MPRPPEPLAHSFAPLLRGDARLLVLGSMPGRASLDALQYYAHPRNAFWPIIAAHCGIDPALGYHLRVAALLDAGIALWDVLCECRRPGSLDSAIELADARPNAIAELLDAHPRIVRVCCNGAAATKLYRRFGLPGAPRIELIQLPSTSPAHAGMGFAEKMRRWHEALSAR
jgi:hypoxanthine-DNA glycosylase